MKRYDLDEAKEYPWWAYMRETENGEYVLFSEAQERIEALEWLVEVQDFYMRRLRNPGGWAPVGCDRGLMPRFWARRENSNTELRDSYKAARAAFQAD